MEIKIISNNEDANPDWDQFAATHQKGCLYHALGWRDAIQRSYGHSTYYLAALNNHGVNQHTPSDDYGQFVGLLPLVHIKNWLFGNSFTSMPFVDSGGLLAKDGLTEESLLLSAITIAEKTKVRCINIRQTHPLIKGEFFVKNHLHDWKLSVLTPKVRMVVRLPYDPDVLMRSFGSKLRSQIRKPIKSGLVVKIGSIELIDDFYNVFVENMRDLGSPVHSKKIIAETLKAFDGIANVFIVYNKAKPLAGSVTIGFKDTLSNPWASSLRRYSHLAPNMLLYWSMLEFACKKGYQRFDFGRSTPGEGTYKFKEQWGSKPEPLYWYRLSNLDDQRQGDQSSKDKMSKAIECWKKLPVPLTKVIGPKIRKYINL